MASCVPISISNTVYIVGASSSKGQVSFSSMPKQHEDYPEAAREATRLANAACNTGSSTISYMVFSLVGVARVENNSPKGF
jgi:hypothetical protein